MPEFGRDDAEQRRGADGVGEHLVHVGVGEEVEAHAAVLRRQVRRPQPGLLDLRLDLLAQLERLAALVRRRPRRWRRSATACLSLGRISSLTIAAVRMRMSLIRSSSVGNRLDVHHHPSTVGRRAADSLVPKVPDRSASRSSQPAESAPGVRGVGDSGAPPGVHARLDLPRKEGRRWLVRPLLTRAASAVGPDGGTSVSVRWSTTDAVVPRRSAIPERPSPGHFSAPSLRPFVQRQNEPQAIRARPAGRPGGGQAGVSRGQAFRRPREPREPQCVRRPSSCRCHSRMST